MSRKQVNDIILIGIIVLTVFSLGISIQELDSAVIGTRLLELSIYAIVTAFAIILSVPLARSELSIAHAIGLMAFLSLPAEIVPQMTIAIFLGGVLGGVIRARLNPTRHYDSPAWTITAIHIITRVTLAYFIASRVYVNFFNADLPISDSLDIRQQFLPLMVAIICYLLVYFLSFLMQIRTYTKMRQALAESYLSLGIILILPVPFAILGASVARTDESILFFTITIIGAILIIFGLFVLNRSQQRLHRQLDEMRSISVATQAMRGSLNLEGLLRTTYVQVTQLLDTENFTVALYNETEMRMMFPLVIRKGDEVQINEHDMLPADYPLIEYILDSGLGLLLENNVSEQARELGIPSIDPKLESWLGIPLMSGDKAIGAFVVQSYDQRRFDNDDLRVMNIIVASTNIAIENARLYRQKSTHAEQLATLNQVTSLLTGTLAPSEVLDTVVSSASTISNSNAVAVYLFDNDKDMTLELARSAGLSDKFILMPAVPLLASKISQSMVDDFVHPSSLLIPNIDMPEADPIHQRMIDENKQAFIEHLLVFAGKNLGILVVYYNKPQNYHSEQLDIIQAFSMQAAQAINNAQRFEVADKALEQRIEQLYALAAMGRLLNASMESNKIYEIVLNYAIDATKASRGFLAIYRPNTSLYVPTAKGYPDDMFSRADFLEQGLTGRVLGAGQALRVSDTRLETGYLPLIPKTRSMLLSPIMKGKDTLGIIMLESDSAGAFSEADGHFIAQIANQAVIAIDNTRLFQRIREARDNMQTILDAMEEGIILINTEGVVTLANPPINLIELVPDDILGQSIGTLIKNPSLKFAEHLGFSNPSALKKLITNLDDNWDFHAPHDYEFHSDEVGIRYIQRQIIPIHDENHHITGIMLVFYNKTEEHELANARESLSQMIVHDLRSPLTAVTTSLRLLQALVPKDTEFAPLVEKTTATSRQAIRKVLTRVDSLLDVSKMQSGQINLERDAIVLSSIITSVIAELHPLAEELDVTLQNDSDSNLPLVYVDADKIERMILNLVDNALKYSPANTTVTVQTKLVNDNFIQLNVMDMGPGIPDEYKDRLFDRFVQIEGRKTVRRGVGLGLTFCKLVVEAHEGKIWVTDNPKGSGSVFKVTLPIADISS